MRPVINIVMQELGGTRFLAADYFDVCGQYADNVIMPVSHIVDIRRVVTELMAVHHTESVDLYTDSDEVFKAFIPIVGVNAHYETAPGLSGTYAHFRADSPGYSAILQLWIPQQSDTSAPREVVTKKRPSLWRRIVHYTKGVIKRDQI